MQRILVIQTAFLGDIILATPVISELKRLLQNFGYLEEQGSGSRVVFVNAVLNHKIKLHKPHPGNILKRYQMDLIEQELQNKELL